MSRCLRMKILCACLQKKRDRESKRYDMVLHDALNITKAEVKEKDEEKFSVVHVSTLIALS